VAAPDDLLILNTGTTQRDRLLAAPEPGRVEVDGRTLEQLLAFAADYGRLIQYYDLENMPDGDWSIFFAHDPSIALAIQAGLDLDAIERELDFLMAELRAARTLEARLQLAERTFGGTTRLVGVLNRGRWWITGIEEALTAAIGLPEHELLLAEPARRMMLHLGGRSVEHWLRRDIEGVVRGWFDAFVEHLEDFAAALLTALQHGRADALKALELSMQAEGHAPQAALYNAFVKLFGYAQETINRFPRRLVAFYHDAILRQNSRVGSPDQLYLTFTPAKGVKQASIPKGTIFPAGADADGKTIAYAIDQALTVDAASVAALRTLTVTQEAPVPTASAVPAMVLSGTVALSDQPPPIAQPFPIFGAATPGTSGSLVSAPASLGFALAGPTLMAAGGERQVSIGLTVDPASLTALTPLLQAIGGGAGLTPQAVLAQVLQAAFALRYSTAGGWIDIEGYSVVPPPDDQSTLFTLAFTLTPDAEPFVAMATTPAVKTAIPPTPGSAVPDPAQPTLLASLLQQRVPVGQGGTTVDIYPYAVLSSVSLSDLSVTVAVSGLADLTLSTPVGPIDTSQPFPLFGSPPVQYAALDIAAPELFAKQLDSFALSIAWFGLPVTSTGFKGYYEAYVIDADGNSVPPGSLFDNMIFQAGLTVMRPGLWTIGTEASGATAATPLYLFRTDPDNPVPAPDAPVLPQTEIDAPSIVPAVPPSYYDPATSTIRLSLAEPAYAFGNMLYPANVMAASVQLTAAASACAQKCGSSQSGAAPAAAAVHLNTVKTTNAQAPDSQYGQSIKSSVETAIANMSGSALKAIHDAIGKSSISGDTKSSLQDSLKAALGKAEPGSLLQRLNPFAEKGPTGGDILTNLEGWIAENSGKLGAEAQGHLGQASAILAAGGKLSDAQAKTADDPPSVARPVMSAAVEDAQSGLTAAAGDDTQKCIQDCMAGEPQTGFPNQPWLPTAVGLTVDYTAAADIPAAGAPDSFFHLLPFDGSAVVVWTAGTPVPLLEPIALEGALYAGLSEPAESLSLLFRMAPPSGGWPVETPTVSWAQQAGDGWTPLTPLRDNTNDLRNSGIVSLSLADRPDTGPVWLRIGVSADADGFPLLAALTTNAATADWVGPGGATTLGKPLPSGTIKKSAQPLPGIGTIDQPVPSFGGRPEETGPAFEMWLAERLRHKDYGILAWDYARLVLAAFPSLWQVAVVQASDPSGGRAPGHVWVVPVPGPNSLNIVDPTIPANDSAMLGEIADMLGAKISPFIQLAVTNPPYRRLKVTARLVFDEANTVQACVDRLNDDLVAFLSPWPTRGLGPRPDDYYTRDQVAHFIRHRPYVLGILSLRLDPDPPGAAGWHYLTSALSHDLTGEGAPRPQRLHRPRLALPKATAAEGAS